MMVSLCLLPYGFTQDTSPPCHALAADCYINETLTPHVSEYSELFFNMMERAGGRLRIPLRPKFHAKGSIGGLNESQDREMIVVLR